MKKIVCKLCGEPLVFIAYGVPQCLSMGSSHSSWYYCENERCEKFNKSVNIVDQDLYSDEVLRA